MQRHASHPSGLSYSESCSGTPLVLLHAFPLRREAFAPQAELADCCRLIVVDLPGFGHSPRLSSTTLPNVAAAVMDLLADVGATPCLLGGNSLGGYVALEAARTRQKDLLGLILIDTKAEGDGPEARDARNQMIALARSAGAAPVFEQMLGRLLGETTRATRPDLVSQTRELMEPASAESLVAMLEAMRDRMDQTENLASIAVPTLILVGEEDRVTPPAAAETMNRLIPRSQLKTIAAAGHLSAFERPAEVNAAIRDFLAAHFHIAAPVR